MKHEKHESGQKEKEKERRNMNKRKTGKTIMLSTIQISILCMMFRIEMGMGLFNSKEFVSFCIFIQREGRRCWHSVDSIYLDSIYLKAH